MAKEKRQENFLQKLQQEASHQALLEKQKVLPSKISGLASLIAHYPIRILLAMSFVTAVLINLLLK